MYDMTGDDNPQGMPGGGFQGGFQGFPGAGINIEDLMRGFGGFGGMGGGFGEPRGFGGQGRFQGGAGGQQKGRRQQTYTFSFGGGMPGGMRF